MGCVVCFVISISCVVVVDVGGSVVDFGVVAFPVLMMMVMLVVAVLLLILLLAFPVQGLVNLAKLVFNDIFESLFKFVSR